MHVLGRSEQGGEEPVLVGGEAGDQVDAGGLAGGQGRQDACGRTSPSTTGAKANPASHRSLCSSARPLAVKRVQIPIALSKMKDVHSTC
ncbi:hypothetical protein [Streptomyces luteireticuli]|uniref:hypothetical protein n=1 Tax=Streptomyces luteireticuli TaxID=173858 RepID=UPI0031CDEB77